MELTRLRAENARLKMERNLLKKAIAYLHRSSKPLKRQDEERKYAWIQAQGRRWPISTMCQVLDVNESGYYHH